MLVLNNLSISIINLYNYLKSKQLFFSAYYLPLLLAKCVGVTSALEALAWVFLTGWSIVQIIIVGFTQ